jgi:putative ABC transport system substrate-binding protein
MHAPAGPRQTASIISASRSIEKSAAVLRSVVPLVAEQARRDDGVIASAAPVRSEADIEDVITQLEREANTGLIVITDSFMFVHRKAIINLIMRHRVPTIHVSSDFVADGGLIAYGVENADLFRRAAPYVDRILRGAKPAELPVQQPTKFELTINLKTARALGLAVPPSLLARADEVIE